RSGKTLFPPHPVRISSGFGRAYLFSHPTLSELAPDSVRHNPFSIPPCQNYPRIRSGKTLFPPHPVRISSGFGRAYLFSHPTLSESAPDSVGLTSFPIPPCLNDPRIRSGISLFPPHPVRMTPGFGQAYPFFHLTLSELVLKHPLLHNHLFVFSRLAGCLLNSLIYVNTPSL
ncbi:hypothetical protein J2Z37_004837, partial [Ammoniphilus resinae]|nr:hypothetical protein [Ammoniphilus resinae]